MPFRFISSSWSCPFMFIMKSDRITCHQLKSSEYFEWEFDAFGEESAIDSYFTAERAATSVDGPTFDPDDAVENDDLQSIASISTLSVHERLGLQEREQLEQDLRESVEADLILRKRSKLTERRAPTAVIPKLMKNDIRRHFSNMFMNTINSADFHRTEDFFRTFMTDNCPFVSQQQLPPEFRIPPAVRSVGPRQFAHYLLGCFVMYPDMAVSLYDTQIITSNAWPGTKIIMKVEYNLTKTHDIPMACWVPPMQALGQVYAQQSVEGMLRVLSTTRPQRAGNTSTGTNTACSGFTDGIGNISSNLRVCSMDSEDFTPASLPVTVQVPASTKKRGRHSNKRKPSAETASISYIPSSYQEALQRGAELMTEPCRLRATGEFALFLDERNQIQRAVLTVHNAAGGKAFEHT